MSSYKDKKKVIDLYYHYGRKITAVTGELTYPDKHTFVQLDQRVYGVRYRPAGRSQQEQLHRRT